MSGWEKTGLGAPFAPLNRSHTREELPSDVRAPDAEASDDFVRACLGEALAVARRILGEESQAREAAGEAVEAALSSAPESREGTSLVFRLRTLAAHSALSRRRIPSPDHDRSIDALLPRFDPAGRWVKPPAVPPLSDPPSGTEPREKVQAALERLPFGHRATLLLRDVAELSLDEAGEVLSLPGAAVKRRLAEARHALHTLLLEEGLLS